MGDLSSAHLKDSCQHTRLEKCKSLRPDTRRKCISHVIGSNPIGHKEGHKGTYEKMRSVLLLFESLRALCGALRVLEVVLCWRIDFHQFWAVIRQNEFGSARALGEDGYFCGSI